MRPVFSIKAGLSLIASRAGFCEEGFVSGDSLEEGV